MYLKTYDDWEKAAERLYLQNPDTARYSIIYQHNKGLFKVKMTDDATCVQYRSESMQEFKKMEKFVSNLLRHMASTEH